MAILVKKMVSLIAFMVISSSLSLVSGRPKLREDSVVEGVVYCQNCKHNGTSSLMGATPVVNAEVKVVCKDKKGGLGFYRVFTTDPAGYFYASLDGGFFKYSLADVGRDCTVRLFSSPDPNCGMFTNINGGLDGARMRRAKSFFRGPNKKGIVYDVGPLVFRPAHCHPFFHH